MFFEKNRKSIDRTVLLYYCITLVAQGGKKMITINNVSKKYNKFEAVKNLSMNLNPGEVYGLVGKNGAGKSTLFKLILGLSKPSSGSIEINKSQTTAQLNKEKRKIGFYMGPSFYPYLNAKDNLTYVAKMKNIKDPNEVTRVLKLVDLDGEKKPFKAYSLGMKQRLGIANALLGDPEIILLDEPINGLDPQGILEIRKIIKDLGSKFNKTVIVSSHILSELELVADRFGIIDQGVLIKEFDHNGQKQDRTVTLRTSNNTLAAKLLSNLSPVESNEHLILKTEILDNHYIKTLIENDIQIREIYTTKNNLEQQYFALTGGQ